MHAPATKALVLLLVAVNGIGCERPPATVRAFFANPNDVINRFDALSLEDKIEVAVYARVREPPSDAYCERLAMLGPRILPALAVKMLDGSDWKREIESRILVLLHHKHAVTTENAVITIATAIEKMSNEEHRSVAEQNFRIVFSISPRDYLRTH